MKVIVIGLGSMGKRRIRLIKKIDAHIEVIGIDSKKTRCDECSEIFDIKTFTSIDAAKQEGEISCAFICTSPLSHADIINVCLQNKWHVFTELNLVSDRYEENIRLAKENNCILFLSSTFFYREELSYIRNNIKNKTNMNYIYHVGQYLPDWHPWENYKDFFVGNSKTNGCREIMAIELPWLIEAFGNIRDVKVISDKMSSLSINYNDNYMIQVTHEDGNKGVLVIDVVSPYAIRNLEIYGEGLYLCWNGTPTGLKQFDVDTKKLNDVSLYTDVDKINGYSSFVIENAYQNEIEEFFGVINGTRQQQYGFEKDLKTLEIIDQIEGL